jgi:hypothetical protein
MEDINNVVDPIVEPTGIADEPTNTNTPELTKEQVETIQKKAYGYAMQHLDQALEEAGFKKPEGVKSTEFVKQILKEGTKNNASNVNDTVDDSEFKAKFEALKNQLVEKDNLIEQLKESTTNQKRDFFLNQIVDNAPITAPDYLGEQEKQRYVDRVKNLIREGIKTNYQLKEVDNMFRFYSKDGEPLFDGTPDMNPIKPSELLNKEFSEFFTKPTTNKKVVAGTGGLDNNGAVTNTTTSVIPPNIQNRYDFYDYLAREKKLTLGSQAFNEQVQLAKKEKPSLFN